MHTKRFNTFSKRLVQLREGAIPCLPQIKYKMCGETGFSIYKKGI